jgi:hypothetical protein
MAEEIDRQIIPDILRTGFAIYVGACYKSVEMMLTPMESAEKLFTEIKPLFELPIEEGLQQKAEVMAGVWMERAAALMDVCKTTGERFTEGK